uniref:Uncharacterized protein n=1 Tax=Romanomermis culicivorax TaxID=13658 RepID=A0A915IDF1_ROMCU
MDIITKNCFNNYDAVACARGALLCLFNIATVVLCLWRLLTLHLYGSHSTINTNYITFFCLATVQCLLGTLEWIFGWTMELSLSCQCLRSMQLLLLCYTYTMMALRLRSQSEGFGARVATACLSLCLIYFTFFIATAFIYHEIPWFDCYANYWLFISAGQLFLVQIVMFAAFLVLTRIKIVTSDHSLQRFRRRSLLFMILALQSSAITSLSYHLSLFIIADNKIGCSGVFKHKQLFYTPFRLTYELFVYLLPIWVLAYCFRPAKLLDGDQSRLLDSPSHSRNDMIARNAATPSGPFVICPGNLFNGVDVVFNEGNFDYTLLFPEGIQSTSRRPYLKRRRTTGFVPFGKPFKGVRKWKRSRSAPSFLKRSSNQILDTIPEESGVSSSSVQSSSEHGSPPPTPAQSGSYCEPSELDRRHPMTTQDYQSTNFRSL